MSPRSTLAPSLMRVGSELALVQSLVRGTLSRRAGFRADAVRAANAQPVSPEEAEALLFDLSLSEQVEPQFEQRLRLVEAERDAAFKAGEPVSLLRKAFALSRRELTVWMLCAAPQLDYRYGRLYGLVIDDPARCYASDDLLQLVLSVGLSTHAQLRALLTPSAPLFALGLIERAEASIGRPPGLRVPSWLIDFLLGSEEGVGTSEPPVQRASEPMADELAERFFAGASPKREHQRLFAPVAEGLALVERVCARARLKQLHADLRHVRASQLRAEAHRAAHRAALRECALVVLLPSAADARGEESFVLTQLMRDLAQLGKHLPLCATLEDGARA